MAALKRYKLLKIELENPERRLYCLAFVIAGEQINKGIDHAAQIFRNVAEYFEEQDAESFTANCLSSSGFGYSDTVDIRGKLGHLERLCEAVFKAVKWDLPEYQACEGYLPLNAVHRQVKRGDIPPIETTRDGHLKSSWR